METKIIYVRFGFIPRNEESRIYEGDRLIGHEIGVSVYEAIQRGDKIHIILPRCSNSACAFLSRCIERVAFIVTGDVVGTGSNGEPLLKNIEKIKNLEITNHEEEKRTNT